MEWIIGIGPVSVVEKRGRKTRGRGRGRKAEGKGKIALHWSEATGSVQITAHGIVYCIGKSSVCAGLCPALALR